MTPPVRPSLRALKRPNRLRAMFGLGIKLAFLAAVLCGVYFLYSMGESPPKAPAQAADVDGLPRQPQPETRPTPSATVAATPPATSLVPEPEPNRKHRA